MKKLELKCWCIFLAFLLVMASPFLLTGCRAKLPPEKITTEVKVTETLHDTQFVEVPDSSSIRALIECQNNKPVLKQITNVLPGRRIRPPSLTLKANTIQCDCKADSLKFIAFWKDRYRELSTQQQKPLLIEKQLTAWQKAWIFLGKSLTAIVMVIVAYKLFKNRLK